MSFHLAISSCLVDRFLVEPVALFGNSSCPLACRLDSLAVVVQKHCMLVEAVYYTAIRIAPPIESNKLIGNKCADAQSSAIWVYAPLP